MTLSPRFVRLIAASLLLVFAAFAGHALPQVIRAITGQSQLFGDFEAQWSFARFAQAGHASRIYDADLLHEFQLTLDPWLKQKFPFPYPPTYLLTIWPLGWMPYGVAYAVWDLVTLALFLWAVFGDRPRPLMLLFVALAPVTVIALDYGQNGLLVSALIVGGMRLMGPRPILGGVLLGLATIKPQLGLLIPVAVLASGRWSVLIAAAASATVLALASVWAFGWDVWPAWLDGAVGHADYLEHNVNNYLKPGIMANLALFGVAMPVAHAVQALVAVVVAAIVWVCFRRRTGDLSIAALQVGTFVAMPYVFRYDMPMLANAILLLVRDRAKSKQQPGLIETGIIVLGLLFPAIVTLTTRFFYVSGIALILLFALSVWRCLASGRDSA